LRASKVMLRGQPLKSASLVEMALKIDSYFD